jgi:hypothetical protein
LSLNSLVEVKNEGSAQWLALTILLEAKVSNTIYANNIVATTEINEPKLEIIFQPAKESG